METAAEVIATVRKFADLMHAEVPAGSAYDKIEILQELERAKRAAAGFQARTTHAFVQARQAQDTAAGIPASLQCKGIEAEVGFARGESAYLGSALTHT
ncbi:MAG TPA: hypothetical protein VIG67_05170, partial [Yaniella sp.]